MNEVNCTKYKKRQEVQCAALISPNDTNNSSQCGSIIQCVFHIRLGRFYRLPLYATSDLSMPISRLIAFVKHNAFVLITSQLVVSPSNTIANN